MTTTKTHTGPLTYGQLPTTAGDVHTACLNPGCDQFGIEYSATRGDYFMMGDSEPFVCECGEPLQLVRRVTRLVPVTL
jgi:hypothetical protein